MSSTISAAHECRADPASTTRWRPVHLVGIDQQASAVLPAIGPEEVRPIVSGLDVWDMWQLQYRDGTIVDCAGTTFWFFLVAPRSGDPEERHDIARIHLLSHDGSIWRGHGSVIREGLSPGTREWSGCAIFDSDRSAITLHFTAAGMKEAGAHFAQRLFVTQIPVVFEGSIPVLGDCSVPLETVTADYVHYAIARDDQPLDGRITGFRDPYVFRDPADGGDYLLFTGSSAERSEPVNGVIGIAKRGGEGWLALPPAIDARGVCQELERPHVVLRDALYYLFWSSRAERFDPCVGPVPTGLYGMVADRIAGPWRPVNRTGLVATNPPSCPDQAYCWWVKAEGDVASFVEYWGVPARPASAGARRAQFGGTMAPTFRLNFDGETVTIAR